MKKEHILWTSICLLLAVVPAPADSAVEEDEEFTNITDMKLPPLKPVQTFCAMKVDDGPCRAFIKRYFFNILTHQCEEFIYGGCEGNENRFVTLEECKENCVRDYSKMTTKLTMQKGKPDFCFLEEDPGICRGYITRYFYNNQSKQCERFKYGGCLGNLNNFESLEECKSTCEDPVNDFLVEKDNTVQRNEISAVNDTLAPQPTKASRLWEFHGPSWCLSPADRGLCQANEIRFYYNANTGRCRPFKYSGCGGNENNFTSKKACFTNCKKGFIRRLSKGGLIKTKRKRKKQSKKIVHEEVFINKT